MPILKPAFLIPLYACLAGCSVTRSIDPADPGEREIRGGTISVTVEDTITHAEAKGTLSLVPGHGADLIFREIAISSASKTFHVPSASAGSASGKTRGDLDRRGNLRGLFVYAPMTAAWIGFSAKRPYAMNPHSAATISQ